MIPIILKIVLWIVGIVVAYAVIPMVFMATMGIGLMLAVVEDGDMATIIARDDTFKNAVAWGYRVFFVGWTLLGCYWLFDIIWLKWGFLSSLVLLLIVWVKGRNNIKRKFRSAPRSTLESSNKAIEIKPDDHDA